MRQDCPAPSNSLRDVHTSSGMLFESTNAGLFAEYKGKKHIFPAGKQVIESPH